MSEETKQKILDSVYNFFISSHDFNGMPLRDVSKEFEIDYVESIELVKDLVRNGSISIQSSTNPHIIGWHHDIAWQIEILEQAKSIKEHPVFSFGNLQVMAEDTEYPICLYPSKSYLKEHRDVSDLIDSPYTKQLTLGEPQLEFHFFEIDVLERYYNDPRYRFDFDDYSGSISCETDENGNTILDEKDQTFLETFGLGFDENERRVAVVFTRYLKDLPSAHQLYWHTKEIFSDCKVLKEYYENAINGEFTNSISIFSAFIAELNCLYDITEFIFGISLLKTKFEGEKRPKEMTFFFLPTSKNYEYFVHLLDKMLSENINKKFFDGKIEEYEFVPIENNLVERKLKGTLKMLEEWFGKNFKAQNKESFANIFKYLKEVRKERQHPAHCISKNTYDEKYIELQKEMIEKAYESVRALRIAFQNHPKAKSFEIPTYLDEAELKVF